MPMTKIAQWDPRIHPQTKEQMASYLGAALADGSRGEIAAALGDLARSEGMSAIAEVTGLGRESLYKSLSENGNPELATVLKVVDALGLKLTVLPSDSNKAA